MSQPNTPCDVEVSARARHQVPARKLAIFDCRTDISTTHHHPCPSKKTPHGSPISRLHTLSLEQYTLSSVQIEKPPKKIDSPYPIINHIVLKIFLSLVSCLSCSFFWSSVTLPCLSISLYASVFALMFGRKLTSMTYMERSSTTAVRIAYMFW